MKVFAVSGGIASGKSTWCEALRRSCREAVVFDCDRSVREMLEKNEEVREALVARFGDEVSEGKGVNRAWLRRRVFGDQKARKDLEGILHPRVRHECLDSLSIAATKGAAIFVADVPLLFESGFDLGQERRLLVAASDCTRVERIRRRNGWDDGMIQQVMSVQMPQEQKLKLADHVFWNEGPVSLLESQVRRFLSLYIDHE